MSNVKTHELKSAGAVTVFKRRTFLRRGTPAAGVIRSGHSEESEGSGSDAEDSDGSGSGGRGGDTQLDDEAVAAADPALFIKVCLASGKRLVHATTSCAGLPET